MPRSLGDQDDVMTCNHVVEGAAPVAAVFLDRDGWQILCGADHSESQDVRIVTAAKLFAQDGSLRQVGELEPGDVVRRDGTSWRRRTADEDELDQAVRANGWVVMPVQAAPPLPPFAHTLGLWGNYQHPEILAIGIPFDATMALLDAVAARVKKGDRFADRDRLGGVLEDVEVILRAVTPENARLLLEAQRYYGGEPPALQCVLPDMQGRYPWEEGVNPRLAEMQPALY